MYLFSKCSYSNKINQKPWLVEINITLNKDTKISKPTKGVENVYIMLIYVQNRSKCIECVPFGHSSIIRPSFYLFDEYFILSFAILLNIISKSIKCNHYFAIQGLP